jgi:hypothetical protein
LKKTDSLRAAVDLITTQIVHPAVIETFKQAIRERSKHLSQQIAVG